MYFSFYRCVITFSFSGYFNWKRKKMWEFKLCMNDNIKKAQKKETRRRKFIFFKLCILKILFSSFWYFYLWHFLIHIFSSWRNEERYWQYNAGELIGRFFWGYFDSFFGFWIAWEEFRHHLAKITETMLNSENLGF